MRLPFESGQIVRAMPRSVLYTSARDPKLLAEAPRFDSDLHLIDLEDSVPPTERPQARVNCREALANDPAPRRAAVRVNPMSTADGLRDAIMLLDADVRPGFVFMTKVEAAVEVTCLRQAFGEMDWFPQVFATIETAAAVHSLPDLVQVLDGMILGSADLAASLGVDITAASLRFARQAMALAASGTGITCFDTGNFRLGDSDRLDEDIAEAKALGFHGKGTVHPKELPAINTAFRPDPDTVAHAARIVEASRAAGGGVCMLDGAMIGPPFVRRATNFLAATRAWEAEFGRQMMSKEGKK